MIEHVSGIKIFESSYLAVRYQFRFPVSKRKRIRKKWAKKESNFRTRPDMNTVYKTPFGIVCHPELAEKIRRMINEIDRLQPQPTNNSSSSAARPSSPVISSGNRLIPNRYEYRSSVFSYTGA